MSNLYATKNERQSSAGVPCRFKLYFRRESNPAKEREKCHKKSETPLNN